MSVTLLDCTLRDGGYYNNWDFSQQVIDDYLLSMASIDVGYVEIGFRSLINTQFKGGCAFSTDDFISSLDIPDQLKDKIGIMINGVELLPKDYKSESYGSKELQNNIDNVLEKLFVEKKKSPVTLVRIACHVSEFVACLPAANWLKNKGYKVGFNIMQVADRDEAQIIEMAEETSRFPVDVLYFADSMGSLDIDRTAEIIKAFRAAWRGDLGIHTHDNMGRALANSMYAVENGVTWVDSTVTGMGRGAGNVQTEYIVIALQKFRKDTVQLTKLQQTIKKHFLPMQKEYGWGMNAYYYLAGSYSVHPSYIQEMLADARYNEEDVLAVIDHLKAQGGKHFSRSVLEAARHFYQGKPFGSWAPVDDIEDQIVLIIGTGPGIINHKRAVEAFIRREAPFVIALNAQQSVEESMINVRAACHPVRLLADCQDHLLLEQPLVTPMSMLPQDVKTELKSKDVRDFGILITPGVFEFHSNYCVIPNSLVLSYSLAIATSGKASKIVLAGFDGYGADDPRRKEIDEVFRLYLECPDSVSLVSITPTRYEIPVISAYGLENKI
jgi:4-hydroxy 2-oxovalerate aldolase